MADIRIPRRRPTRRIYRWRPRTRAAVRRNRIIQGGLLAAAAVCLALFAAALLRSARTAETNRTYAAWKEAAESLPTAVPRAQSRVERMTRPDGSPVTREDKQRAGIPVSETVAGTKYHLASGDPLPAMAALRQQNGDLVAWLKIDGVLDLPVVYRNNEWYLNHDFEGNRSPSGTLFLDEAHPLSEETQTLLIHGHNMKDGSMFAQVTHYQQADWWRRHPCIQLTTLWEQETYAVFAVVRTATDPADPDYVNFFTHRTFATDREFQDYIQLLEAKSCFHSFLTVRPEDALLELSTCIGEERLVVAARRLRENESPSGIRNLVAYGN